MYDTDRPAFLESDLIGLSVDSNWQVWGGEPVSIHMVGKGVTGFPNVETLHSVHCSW